MGVPAAPSVQAGKNLYDRLALERMQVELARRVTDVNKFLIELKQMADVRRSCACVAPVRLATDPTR